MNRAMLDKIAGAQVVQRADRFRDGKYVLLVRRVLCETKTTGDFFIAEFEVLEAQAVRPDVTPNVVGSTVGFALNLSKANSPAPGNAKAFVLGLLGFEGEPTREEFVETLVALTSDKQPARGMIVAAETYRTPIKSRPGDEYLGINWRHLAQKPEQIAERRARLDGKG